MDTEEVCFPAEFPYEFESFAPSPESPMCSMEEEQLFARLSLQLSGFNLDEKHGFDDAGWWARSTGASNGASRTPSPPFAAEDKKSAWEVLYAAADQVAKMRMVYEGGSDYDHPFATLDYSHGIQRNRLIQPDHNHHFKAFQTQPGSGIRAGFHGGLDLKRVSGGTGVFLPRTYDVQLETRKKSAGTGVFVHPQRSFGNDMRSCCGTRTRNNRRFGEPRQNPPLPSNEGLLPQEWTY